MGGSTSRLQHGDGACPIESAQEAAVVAERRLREAIDVLPEGIVFLDADGRYILWNQQYSEIYAASADLLQPGARLADTLRVGIQRGDYPESAGREEEWLAQRLSLLENPGVRHEQRLANGRVIMIEERKTRGGGTIGLRVDITEMKQREESFRLLFEGNPVPLLVVDRSARRSAPPTRRPAPTSAMPRGRSKGSRPPPCSKPTNGTRPAPCWPATARRRIASGASAPATARGWSRSCSRGAP